MSLSSLVVRVRSRFWYLPCLYGILAFILGIISIKVEFILGQNEKFIQSVPSILLADKELAQTILSTISASLLTMTTITFSTILVVLTTYLSQFSPRTIQNFISDHSTQRVLGIFVGGFIYSILLLLLLKENKNHAHFLVPSFAVLFAIVCLVVFVFFIHHVTSWMKVSNLIHEITSKTIQKIEKQFEDEKDVTADPPWEDWESMDLQQLPSYTCSLPATGYIQYIDIKGLVNQASKDDTIIRIEKKLGDYVDQETQIVTIWKTSNKTPKNSYDRYFTIGPEKIPVEDIQFGITKLVEIALRALSPGINDPNTAINCIEQLGFILARLGKKYIPRSFHNDGQRNLRVMLDNLTFSDYLYKTFYQIRHYGSSDVSINATIFEALTVIADGASRKRKDIIWEFTKYILEGIQNNPLLSLDKRYLDMKLQRLARASGHLHEYKKTANLQS